MPGDRQYDVVIIGAGHNGLTAAAYLARAGLRTLVLERRDIVGGCCVTETLWPGFRVSRAAYVAGLLRPAVLRELRLAEAGLTFLPRNPSSFTPLADGGSLLLGPDLRATCDEIRFFSPKDAMRYPNYERFLDRIARTMEPLLDAPPINPARLHLRQLGSVLAFLRHARRLGKDLPAAVALLTGSATRLLSTWFESEPLRGTLATDAVIGAWAGPSSPGTGYVLLHHVMGETNGVRGVWSYVRGGMGSISEALAATARGYGAEIRCDAQVASIRVKDGRSTGVLLQDGTEFRARAIASNADPKVTMLDLVAPDWITDDARDAIADLDFRSPVMKINVALDRLPEFPSRPGVGPHHRGTIHIGATSLAELEESFQAAEAGRLPDRPMIELTIPSVLDDSLAPEGQHVASLFVQHVPYAPSGSNWNIERDRFADTVCSVIDEVAPGFSQSVLHRDILAPPDLKETFGLTGGNIFHGAMTPDRLLFMRPLPGWGNYRTPVDGLYLCGAGTHPGGGVTGACGRNAARVILHDLKEPLINS